MSFNIQTLDRINISFAAQFVKQEYFNLMCNDMEHYKLIARLANQFTDNTLYDIGSYRGLSAIAMSYNQSNKIISYDIENLLDCKIPNNVEFKIGDCFQDENLLKSPFIVVDVDPHDGKFEHKFMSHLTQNNYKGVIVFDDIYLNDGMKEFWFNIEYEKYDLTKFGHWSGTGLVEIK
jgi:hypothetical protein